MQISSASRQLYTLLKQAREQDGKQHSNIIWASILGAKTADYDDVSQKLGKFFVLFESVDDEIRSLKVVNHDTYLAPLNRLRTALMLRPLMGSAWESVQSHLNHDLEMISACADVVESQNRAVFELSSEDLEDLRQSIRNLQDEILNSDIDAETKRFLVNELRKIEESLLDYQITGSTGVAKVSEEVVGRTFPRWGQAVETTRDLFGKVLGYALELDKLIRAGGTIHKLLDGVKDHISLLPPS